jgi:colicin import membrane protein
VNGNEGYADSFQALESDRRMAAEPSIAHGDDWFDDENNALIAAQQQASEKKRLAGLSGRINRAVQQMQLACSCDPSPQDAQHGAQGVSMTQSTELAEVPPAETALQVFTTEKGLEPWLQQVRLKVDEFNKTLPELTTQKGRDRYASMAHQIAKSKTALEAVGKALSAKQKELPKKIDAERKRVWDTLELWQKEVRKPLDEWQAAEDARVDKHRDAILRITALASDLEGIIVDDLLGRIEMVEAVELGDRWQEFETEAARAKDDSLKTLRDTLVVRQKHEAELAEIARFNAEKAERERAEHEAVIARDAAERAQREADQRAQAEREAAAQRELQLKLQAEQAERAAAQEKADRLAAEQRAEQNRIAAERRHAEAVEQARLDELARQQAAADEILRQEKVREADVEHRRTINRAAIAAFMTHGMTEACAKQAITLIASKQIPAITIAY